MSQAGAAGRETPPADAALTGPATSPATAPAAAHELVIRPSKGWMAVDWAELWRYRELLFFLVWRDVKVRYKQAVLGFAWAVLQPVMSAAIFTLIFGFGLNLRGNLSVPYPLYVFSGLLVWQLFAAGMTNGGMSLVNQQHLLTKIYFPRLFVPTAIVGGSLFDLLIATPVLAGMLLYYGVTPSWTIVFLPLLVLQLAMFTLGMAYLLSALTVTYRDFRFLIPFMTQIWMWVSFIAIPLQPGMANNPKWQALLVANPMFGIVSAFRRMVLNQHKFEEGWNPTSVAVSAAVTVVIFVFGLFFFRRTERKFADIA